MGELWNNEVFEMVKQRCAEADRDEDKAQNFLDFITDTEIPMRGRGSFIGSGLYFTSIDSCIGAPSRTLCDVVVTQFAIQTWAKKRGLRTSQRALKESARDLREAGLDIDIEPKSHRVGSGVIWGVGCRRALINRDPFLQPQLTLHSLTEDSLTQPYNILTPDYRDKNNKKTINVSTKEKETATVFSLKPEPEAADLPEMRKTGACASENSLTSLQMPILRRESDVRIVQDCKDNKPRAKPESAE